MLKKMCLVLTYEDTDGGKWHMLMPEEVRISLSAVAKQFMVLAKGGKKTPSDKELSMNSMLNTLLGHSNFTISYNTVTIHGDKADV